MGTYVLSLWHSLFLQLFPFSNTVKENVDLGVR